MGAAPIDYPEAEYRQARPRFSDAITGLIGARFQSFDRDNGTNTVHEQDCRYQQLRDHLAGQQGSGNTHARTSVPTIWADAADILRIIDTEVERWQPDPGIFDGDLTTNPTPTTVRRLRLLDHQRWRPQDTGRIAAMTTQLTTWCADIDELMDPPRSMDLVAPCPACGESIGYHRDSAGEWVRGAALQVTTSGCRCLCCRYEWGPDRFRLLAEVIGCAMPAGVLE